MTERRIQSFIGDLIIIKGDKADGETYTNDQSWLVHEGPGNNCCVLVQTLGKDFQLFVEEYGKQLSVEPEFTPSDPDHDLWEHRAGVSH